MLKPCTPWSFSRPLPLYQLAICSACPLLLPGVGRPLPLPCCPSDRLIGLADRQPPIFDALYLPRCRTLAASIHPQPRTSRSSSPTPAPHPLKPIPVVSTPCPFSCARSLPLSRSLSPSTMLVHILLPHPSHSPLCGIPSVQPTPRNGWCGWRENGPQRRPAPLPLPLLGDSLHLLDTVGGVARYVRAQSRTAWS